MTTVAPVRRPNSLDELVIYVASQGFDFQVHEPAALVEQIKSLAARLASATEQCRVRLGDGGLLMIDSSGHFEGISIRITIHALTAVISRAPNRRSRVPRDQASLAIAPCSGRKQRSPAMCSAAVTAAHRGFVNRRLGRPYADAPPSRKGSPGASTRMRLGLTTTSRSVSGSPLNGEKSGESTEPQWCRSRSASG